MGAFISYPSDTNTVNWSQLHAVSTCRPPPACPAFSSVSTFRSIERFRSI